MCFGILYSRESLRNTRCGEAMPKYINMGVELGA